MTAIEKGFNFLAPHETDEPVEKVKPNLVKKTANRVLLAAVMVLSLPEQANQAGEFKSSVFTAEASDVVDQTEVERVAVDGTVTSTEPASLAEEYSMLMIEGAACKTPESEDCQMANRFAQQALEAQLFTDESNKHVAQSLVDFCRTAIWHRCDTVQYSLNTMLADGVFPTGLPLGQEKLALKTALQNCKKLAWADCKGGLDGFKDVIANINELNEPLDEMAATDKKLIEMAKDVAVQRCMDNPSICKKEVNRSRSFLQTGSFTY